MTAGPGLRRGLCALCICALHACYLDNPGDTPPRGTLYFPNALALSQREGGGGGGAPRFLFVANSNFDLRYNAGSLQAYDLDAIAQRIDDCERDECRTIDASDVLAGEVRIGSFSTSLAVSADGRRVFAATRTDDSLGFAEIDPDAEPPPGGPGVLRCAGGESSPCVLADRGLDRRASSERRLEWPSEPSAVLAGRLADFDPSLALQDDRDEYVLVSHRAGATSLFVERGDDMVLADVLPGGSPFAANLAFDPETRFAYAALDQFGLGNNLTRVRVHLPSDSESPELDAFVGPAAVIVIGGTPPEPRDLAFLPALPGMSSALSTPSAVVVAGRPSALLLTDLPTTDADARPSRVRVKDETVLGFGAARVATAVVDGVPLAVVSSFDAREVAVVDLRTMRSRSMRPNLSGPFDVAIDAVRRFAYVTDFRSSVLRVIDLAPLLVGDADGSLEVIATVGRPRVIQELQ